MANFRDLIKQNGGGVYSPSNKPTPADLGAVNKAGDTITGELKVNVIKDTSNNTLFNANAESGNGTYIANPVKWTRLFAKDGVIQVQNQNSNIYRIYHQGYKPTAADVGAISQATADGRYLAKTAKAADSSLLDGVDSTQFLRADQDDIFNGDLVSGTRNKGIFGVYDSNKVDHIWSMGTAYRIAADGSNFGNLYGLAYKHTNNTTGGTMAGGHQMVWCTNGTPRAALGDNGIWTSGVVLQNAAQSSAGNSLTRKDYVDNLAAHRVMTDNLGTIPTHEQAVIRLFPFDAATQGTSANNYFRGIIRWKRDNGLSPIINVEIAAYKQYNASTAVGTARFFGLQPTSSFRTVKFEQDGKTWLGLQIAHTAAQGWVEVEGDWSHAPARVSYYNSDTSAVMDAEVRDSIVGYELTQPTGFRGAVYVDNGNLYARSQEASPLIIHRTTSNPANCNIAYGLTSGKQWFAGAYSDGAGFAFGKNQDLSNSANRVISMSTSTIALEKYTIVAGSLNTGPSGWNRNIQLNSANHQAITGKKAGIGFHDTSGHAEGSVMLWTGANNGVGGTYVAQFSQAGANISRGGLGITDGQIQVNKSTGSMKGLTLHNKADGWNYIAFESGGNTSGAEVCHLAWSNVAQSNIPANSLHFRAGGSPTQLSVDKDTVRVYKKLSVIPTGEAAIELSTTANQNSIIRMREDANKHGAYIQYTGASNNWLTLGTYENGTPKEAIVVTRNSADVHIRGNLHLNGGVVYGKTVDVYLSDTNGLRGYHKTHKKNFWIGTRNTSYCHMDTDTPAFYSYKPFHFSQGINVLKDKWISLNGKGAFRATDTSWLRINDSGQFTSGIFCGSSLLRTDGSITVGSYGGKSSDAVRIARPTNTSWGADKTAAIDIGGCPATGSTASYSIRMTDTANARIFALETLDQTGDTRLWAGKEGHYFYFDHDGNFTAQGNVTAYSDKRVKENFKVIDNALEKVTKLEGMTYDRIDLKGKREVGLIAQEVEKVLPEAVHTVEHDEFDDFKSLDYSRLVPLLIESIKELNQKVANLETLVNAA